MSSLKEKSATYFDRVAKNSQIIKEPQQCYPFVVDLLKDESGRLLDIGCGEGTLLSLFSERYADNFELFGVDISNNALENAAKRLGDNAVLKLGDSEHLPFDSNMFDAVTCTHSFHHYPNPGAAVKEMHRCLKENGTVCIVENYRSEIPRRIRNLAYIILRHPKGDIKFYSEKEMRQLLADAGFHSISYELITKKSFIIKGTK